LRAEAPPADWQIHRHAVLQPDVAGWRLSSPLSSYQLQVADAGLLDGLRERSVVSVEGLASLLARALWAGGLAERPGDDDGAALSWSHEDLLFHDASRHHADHRPRGKRTTRPAWAPSAPTATASAPLEEDLRRRLQSLSFESVLAQRRSVRGRLPPPTLDELRDLLRVVQAERGELPTAPCRAYPMAGGLQALDFHLVTAASPGAAATLYGFDAAAGLLQPVDSPAGSAQRLLDGAALAWGATHGTPCALVVVTARLPELAARYEATAYRLALLEAGGASLLLTQVATALGLGTCLLGNGDSKLFAWASGLPEWQAPAVGEVAIAGRLADQR
jgi:SagB-type dehydrogenase family enzyme